MCVLPDSNRADEWSNGDVGCIHTSHVQDHVQKPQQSKWTFVPSPSNRQDELTVELEVRHSPFIEKTAIPETIPPDPKLDLHSGLLTAAGVEQLDTESQELQGIWKDRAIFSTQSSATSLHSDQGVGCGQSNSTLCVQCHPSEDHPISNLKGAWATKGMTGAHVVKQSTPLPLRSVSSASALRFPVEEQGGTLVAHPCHCCHGCVAHHPHSPQCCLHGHSPRPYCGHSPFYGQTSGESSRNSSFSSSFSSQEMER